MTKPKKPLKRPRGSRDRLKETLREILEHLNEDDIDWGYENEMGRAQLFISRSQLKRWREAL